MLVAEKDQGLQKLNTAIENGEKLYPDTAAPGREKIRQQLRLAKDVWDGLVSDLSEAQHQAETSAAQVKSFTSVLTSHVQWLIGS